MALLCRVPLAEMPGRAVSSVSISISMGAQFHDAQQTRLDGLGLTLEVPTSGSTFAGATSIRMSLSFWRDGVLAGPAVVGR